MTGGAAIHPLLTLASCGTPSRAVPRELPEGPRRVSLVLATPSR
jgi:hypothetical protein